jgi:YVTN family beta-propeller protein
MRLRKIGGLAAVVGLIGLWMACGEYYRPVVIPLTTTPPTPANFHAVFAITTGESQIPGTAMQIDVSGDTITGETANTGTCSGSIGMNPTSVAVPPNFAQVYVASAGSLGACQDTVSILTPGFIIGGGLSILNTVSLPTGSLPSFVTTTQNGFVYVASFGTNSVTQINTTSAAAGNPAPVGTNPVAMAETPNGNKLYVANQGSNSVTSLNTVDLSQNTVTGFTGNTPVWVVARTDSQKVYVLTQGDGQLVPIDTTTDTVLGSKTNLAVGQGANFILYDPNLNRLYVTNPINSTVYVFSATGGIDPNTALPNDTPTLLATISLSAGANAPCPNGCSPVSVAALPDGSRFYVASYQTAASCPDTNVKGACVIPQLTVFDAKSLALKIRSVPLLSNLQFAATQFAVPTVTSCATTTPYTPGATRFRLFATAAADSSRVYVGMCDAGAIAVINTTDSNTNNPNNATPADSLVTDLLAPPGVCVGTSCGGQVPPQNPQLLVTGQ